MEPPARRPYEQESVGRGLRQVLLMSWPASLTMLNSTLLKFVDGLMVSRVGPLPFAAQYVAGMASFVPESFLIGLLTVVNTYVSQNFGAGRRRQAGLYAWAGMFIAILAASAMAPLAIAAAPIFRLAERLSGAKSVNPELIALEALYFRYMVLSAALTLCCRVLEQFFYGIHRPRIVLAASLAANTFNVGANYVLIYGKLGFPALGLEGAAIGTVTSWGLQLLILLAAYLRPAMGRTFGAWSILSVRPRQCGQIVRLGWPAGLQLCNDIAAWAIFTAVLVRRFGEAHLAATTVAMRYMGLSFMPAVGIGVATTAIVGRCIGQGRHDLARKRTHTALLVAMTYMGLCGLAFWLFRHDLARLFVVAVPSLSISSDLAGALAAEVIEVYSTILLCAAVFQLLDAVGIIYIGALRGAGDTFWPMVATIALSWGVTIGGGVLAIRWLPQFASIGPWLAASLYVIVLGVVMAHRFEMGGWRGIDLLRADSVVEAAPPGRP